jgi:hypothetical protein
MGLVRRKPFSSVEWALSAGMKRPVLDRKNVVIHATGAGVLAFGGSVQVEVH